MKFLQLSMGPTSLVFHPADQCLATQDRISRDALLHFNPRGDGTYLVLYQLMGERRVVEETLANHDAVLDSEIVSVNANNVEHSCCRGGGNGDSDTNTTNHASNPNTTNHASNLKNTNHASNPNNANSSHSTDSSGSNGIHAFVSLDASASDGLLVDMAHRHALIIDTPITFDGDTMRVTLVGTETGLRNMLQSMPDDVDFAVHDAGEYDPGSNDLLSPLTDRQLEVFETAVEQGYYDVPRRATHRDLAGTLGCAPSTVDEHLRKAESSVVTDLF
jgi:predicted DNA binding protein